MKIMDEEFTIEEVFRGLTKKDIRKIKILLPLNMVTKTSLKQAMDNLTPEQQWEIDDYLEKAIHIQRARFYLLRSLVISIILVIIASVLIFINIILRGD